MGADMALDDVVIEQAPKDPRKAPLNLSGSLLNERMAKIDWEKGQIAILLLQS